MPKPDALSGATEPTRTSPLAMEEDDDLQRFIADSVAVQLEQAWPRVRQLAVARATKRQEDKMGEIHNAIVGILTESRLSMPHINLVLDLVKHALLAQAAQRFIGGGE